jgi:hypothetical protein
MASPSGSVTTAVAVMVIVEPLTVESIVKYPVGAVLGFTGRLSLTNNLSTRISLSLPDRMRNAASPSKSEAGK